MKGGGIVLPGIPKRSIDSSQLCFQESLYRAFLADIERQINPSVPATFRTQADKFSEHRLNVISMIAVLVHRGTNARFKRLVSFFYQPNSLCCVISHGLNPHAETMMFGCQHSKTRLAPGAST